MRNQDRNVQDILERLASLEKQNRTSRTGAKGVVWLRSHPPASS